jgi:hypothetical protein
LIQAAGQKKNPQKYSPENQRVCENYQKKAKKRFGE